jgi:3-phenylpropionate/trans-cinnamate dioxygenase ferredoxin subunit
VKFLVGRADEIPPGSRKIVRIAGRSIGVFNIDGEFFAIRNRCPHQGAPLCEGKLWGVLSAETPGNFVYEGRKEIIACIWHGWEFNIRTGQSWCDPQRLRVRSYELSLEQPDALREELPVAPLDAVKNRMVETVNTAAVAEEEESPPAPGMVKGPYTVATFKTSLEDGFLYLVLDVADLRDGG